MHGYISSGTLVCPRKCFEPISFAQVSPLLTSILSALASCTQLSSQSNHKLELIRVRGSHKPLDWLTASLMCCLTWCTIGYPLQTLETCVISFTSETRSPWQSSHLQNKANYINPAISIQVCPQMIRLCLWTLKYKQSTQHIAWLCTPTECNIHALARAWMDINVSRQIKCGIHCHCKHCRLNGFLVCKLLWQKVSAKWFMWKNVQNVI